MFIIHSRIFIFEVLQTLSENLIERIFCWFNLLLLCCGVKFSVVPRFYLPLGVIEIRLLISELPPPPPWFQIPPFNSCQLSVWWQMYCYRCWQLQSTFSKNVDFNYQHLFYRRWQLRPHFCYRLYTMCAMYNNTDNWQGFRGVSRIKRGSLKSENLFSITPGVNENVPFWKSFSGQNDTNLDIRF